MYDVEPEEMGIADEVAYADTGRPWTARTVKRPAQVTAIATPRPVPAQPEGSAA